MGKDPYKEGLIKKVSKWEKMDVVGKLVLVLDTEMDERGLNLIAPYTRAIPKGEICELLITDEEGAFPGKLVNRVAGIGFLEVKQGGIVVVGDKVFIDRKCLGEVAGFDETHMPNHLNIVVKSSQRAHGVKLGFRPKNKVIFTQQRG